MRAVLGGCLAVAVAVVLPEAAAAATPATLTVEVLQVQGIVSAECERSGTVSYTASGTASGPYSGTFTETGRATGTFPSGTLTSLSASFTINSPSGAVLVRGTTTGTSGDWCSETSANTNLDSATTYQATIFTASGNYSDEGASEVRAGIDAAGTAVFFNESFSSALPVLLPTSKDQCKHGGWRTFLQFKNQGDCVSFVASGGKNPPTRRS